MKPCSKRSLYMTSSYICTRNFVNTPTQCKQEPIVKLKQHNVPLYPPQTTETVQIDYTPPPLRYLESFAGRHECELGRRFQPPELAVLVVRAFVVLQIYAYVAGVAVPATVWGVHIHIQQYIYNSVGGKAKAPTLQINVAPREQCAPTTRAGRVSASNQT